MAGRTRKRVEKETETDLVGIRDAILDAVRKQYNKHAQAIQEVQGESEQNIVNINFKVKIDGSEAETTVATTISYSARVAETLVAHLADPNQPEFEYIGPGADESEGGEAGDPDPGADGEGGGAPTESPRRGGRRKKGEEVAAGNGESATEA